jgi:hypothetical protein
VKAIRRVAVDDDRSITLLLMLYSLGLALWLAVNRRTPTIDDSFYYLKIAQHLAQGQGSTFDGINLTNGYHPLWLWCLVPVFWFSADPESTRMLATTLQAFFFATSVGLYYLSARFLLSRFSATLATFLWAQLAYRYSLSGMEFGLYALAVSAFVFVYLRLVLAEGKVRPQSYFTLGLMASVTFLARVEAILLAACIGVSLAIREWQRGFDRKSIAKLFRFALPPLGTLVAYAAINLLLFGTALPVSGPVKHAWSEYYVTQSPIYQTQGWLAVKLALLSLPMRALFQLRHLSQLLYPLYLVAGTLGAVILYRFDRNLKPLAPLIWFSVVHLIGYVIALQDSFAYMPWYFVIQPWLAAMLLGSVADRLLSFSTSLDTTMLTRGFRCLVTSACIILWLGIPIYTLRNIFPLADVPPAPREPLLQAAEWIDANLPSDATVGAWNAGIIGFYSRRRVVNLDGLVNSWEFFHSRQYDLCRYWDETGITYLADAFENDRVLSSVPAYPYYAHCADRLEILWSDRIPGISARIKVYRIRPK